MITDRGLTVAQRESLERDGYLLVASLLDRAAVDGLRARLAELVAGEVAAGRADYGNPGTVEAGVVHAKLDPRTLISSPSMTSGCWPRPPPRCWASRGM